MKIHTLSRTSSVATIAESHAEPLRASPLASMPRDDKMAGFLLAQECSALAQSQQRPWTGLCHKLFGLTVEGRVSFMDSLKATAKETRKQLTETHGSRKDSQQAKDAHASLGTANVRCSHMATIAHAINAGMDYGTLAAFYKVPDPENLSIDLVYQLAKTYRQAAAGRKPDPFIVKLGKWLDKATEDDKATAEYASILALYESLKPAA